MLKLFLLIILLSTYIFPENRNWEIEIKKQDDLKWANQELERYEIDSNKKPTLKNILDSLENCDKSKYKEISSAISIFYIFKAREKDKPKLINALSICYKHNTEWYIREGIISILLEIDLKVGIPLCLELFETKNQNDIPILNYKISISRELLRKKSLIEYPYLIDWLLSQNIDYLIERSSGPYNFKELFREFLRFDGHSYNEKGDKIDINVLMQTLKIKLDPKYYEILEKLRKEGPKPEEPKKPIPPWLEELYIPE